MVTEGICGRCWRVAHLCPGQLELLLVDGASHMGAWRDAPHRRLDRMARHAPVGRSSARRDELSDHARVEPCPANAACRERQRDHSLHHPADPAGTPIPWNAAAGTSARSTIRDRVRAAGAQRDARGDGGEIADPGRGQSGDAVVHDVADHTGRCALRCVARQIRGVAGCVDGNYPRAGDEGRDAARACRPSR